MQLFERVADDDYEQVVYCQDRPTGLKAIIAIHSTALGPALGGTRFYPYATEDDALEDVLRLARAMTHKSAAAGLDLGGGKAVIIGAPATLRSESLLRIYGRFIDSLGGRYITAEDVGTTEADMNLIREETVHVTGVSRGRGGSGDPSAATAYGVLHGMKAVASFLWGDTCLAGRHVVVTGMGKVGYALVPHLVDEEAKVTVSDTSGPALARAVTDFAVDVVEADMAHALECDIWSPCAMGGALDATTIPQLRCAAVVGAANNQLTDASCVELLEEAGVLYAPDYVVNAGGVINVAEELVGYDPERAYAQIRGIYDTTLRVLQTAASEGIATVDAANRLVEWRMSTRRADRIRSFHRDRAR